MSAAEQLDAGQVVPELHLAEQVQQSVAEMHAKEMNRWMLWFGIPVLVMAFFIGATFVTDSVWGIGGVLAALIADIGILIWLCMSSDTNGAGAPVAAAGH
jgi:ATP/ADP translocase